jgi:hypothetical protein
MASAIERYLRIIAPAPEGNIAEMAIKCPQCSALYGAAVQKLVPGLNMTLY